MNAPKLYNPMFACVLALLFTPMFGGFLHAANWRELGNTQKAELNMSWVRRTFVTFAVYVVAEPFIRDTLIGRYLMIALFFGLWLSWLPLGIEQCRYVARTVGRNYVSARWGKPLMLGTLGWITYTAIAIALILLLHVTGIDPLPATAPVLQ
ncbi:MAG: hypothetical protein SPJ12_00605 [Duodenibacillus sp.]|nr:hypothetical protein [Duodenibacillus sp.]